MVEFGGGKIHAGKEFLERLDVCDVRDVCGLGDGLGEGSRTQAVRLPHCLLNSATFATITNGALFIKGFITAFAALHLVALARWRPPLDAICTQTGSHVGNKGS